MTAVLARLYLSKPEIMPIAREPCSRTDGTTRCDRWSWPTMPFAQACRPIALQMRLPRLHKRHSTVRLQATAIPHEGLVETQKLGIRLPAQVEILPGRSTFAQIMTFRAATRAVQRPDRTYREPAGSSFRGFTVLRRRGRPMPCRTFVRRGLSLQSRHKRRGHKPSRSPGFGPRSQRYHSSGRDWLGAR